MSSTNSKTNLPKKLSEEAAQRIQVAWIVLGVVGFALVLATVFVFGSV